MTRFYNDQSSPMRETLTREEAEAYERLERPSMFELATDVLRGRSGCFMLGSLVTGKVMLVLGIYSVVRFLGTSDIPEMLRWGAVLFFCLGAIAAVKMWFWMEMNRHALSREIKRLELQIAHLARRSGGDDPT